MQVLWTACAIGIGLGSVYALVALGYTFVVRTTGAFNFAQSPLVAIGALLAYTLVSQAGWPVVPAAVVTVLVTALANVVVERLAIRTLFGSHDLAMPWLLSTLGASVLLSGAAERIWGTQPLGVPSYLPFTVLHLGSVRVASSYLLAFLGAVAIALVIHVVQRYSLWGRTLRALGDNRAAVELAGVSLSKAGLIAFAFGGAVAGLGGFLVAPVTFAQADAGFSLAILAFASLAIGGFGSHWGAIAGGWIVGLIESFGSTYLGIQYEDVLVLGFLVLVLWLRPDGLAGARGVRHV